MDRLMEEHIKFEAEEASQISDHVWEEVVIENTSIPTWKQDLEDEDGSLANDVIETMSEGEEITSEITDNPTSVTEISPISSEPTVTKSSPVKIITTATVTSQPPPLIITNTTNIVQSSPMTVTTNINSIGDSCPMPIVTNVKSLARPVQKIVNLNQLKLLPKGSFVNIGNKKMKLIPFNGDKKLLAGKVVTVTGSDNKVITGKVVSLTGPQKILPKIAKVVTVPTSSNNASATASLVNKVIPAKVVSVPNTTKLKPIAPKNKEVTIYITGLAGDKVQIRDSAALPQAQREDDTETWKSDHFDACLPSNLSGEDWTPDTEVTEGHFLLDGGKILDTGTFTCQTCDRQFTQLKYLLNHQQTHLLIEPVSCDSCDKQFKRRYDLLRHKRRAHSDNTIYECDVCHKTFTDCEVANKHRLTHTEDFKYCCEVCNRPFRYVHDLKRHRSIHFDEKPFDCEICGKKFKHKSNLKTHQSTHYSEKPYSCTLCEKRFHQKGNLKTHLIVHTGEMPFICSICSKRFHTRSGLLNHSYSHSDEKPFQCDICDKTFNWKSGLLTHQQTHRRVSAVSPQIIPEEVEVIEIGPIPVD